MTPFLSILGFVVSCFIVVALITAAIVGRVRHHRELAAMKAAADLRRELDARSVALPLHPGNKLTRLTD